MPLAKQHKKMNGREQAYMKKRRTQTTRKRATNNLVSPGMAL